MRSVFVFVFCCVVGAAAALRPCVPLKARAALRPCAPLKARAALLRAPPVRMEDEPERKPAGKISVPWTVLLLPLCAPLTFFGEENWAAMKAGPAGGFFRVMSNGVFDTEAVVDGAGTAFETAIVPTAGIFIFIFYQIAVQLYQLNTGRAPRLTIDVPRIDLGGSQPAASGEEADEGSAGLEED